MQRLGFVTARFLDGLFFDDALAARALEARGCTVTPVVWNERFDARAFDALVIRSPWDWYKHRPAVRAFLASLASTPVRVCNPPAMLERYADKTYFRHLDTLGVATVPTAFFTPARLDEVAGVMEQRRWRRAVLKPSFTANAYGAQRFEADDVMRVIEVAKQHPVDSEWMLQPYVEGIESEGEWSLVFFAGVFSHAVRKQPKGGDFRVQPDHGGSSALAEPPAPLVAAAQHAIDAAVPDALYARVDGVVHDSRFCVMELEVVEPELFFRLHPQAPERFADALLAQLTLRR